MPATNTPPTADGLAAALALIDAMKPRDGSEGAPRMTAVYAVARAAVDHRYLDCDATAKAFEDALAALCALAAPAPEAALATATGHATATAGEGAS